MLVAIISLLAITEAGIPSVSLTDVKKRAVIEFLDFDRTIVTISFGAAVTRVCRNQSSTGLCGEPGQLVAALNTLPKQEVIDKFGDEARIDRLANHFRKQASKHVKLFILSTSYEEVTPQEWANFIYRVLEIVGFEHIFPLQNILTLADPGPGTFILYTYINIKVK